MAKVLVQALAFGTIHSIVNGGVLHFNPDGSDPRAREREVDEEDVQRLVDAGIVKAPKGYKKTPLHPENEDGEPMGDAASRKIEEREVPVDDTDNDSSVVGTLAAVAHPDETLGIDASGLAEEDPDAPPAPAPAASKSAPKPAAKK